MQFPSIIPLRVANKIHGATATMHRTFPSTDLKRQESSHERSKKSKKKSSRLSKGGTRSRRKVRRDSDDSAESEGSTSGDEIPTPSVASQESPLGCRVSGLVEIQARRYEFRPLLNYRTYRLKDTHQVIDEKYTLRVTSLLKRMKQHLDYRYSGIPPLKVLYFLETFKEAMDIMCVCEGLATILLPHALEGDARSGVQSLWKQGNGGKHLCLIRWPTALCRQYFSRTSRPYDEFLSDEECCDSSRRSRKSSAAYS
jgi:hypothetical protein